MACRQSPARVDGMLDCSWPDETLAAAAEDTGKRSPSMGQGYSFKSPDRERAEPRLHPLTGKIQPNGRRFHEKPQESQAVFASASAGASATAAPSSASLERCRRRRPCRLEP